MAAQKRKAGASSHIPNGVFYKRHYTKRIAAKRKRVKKSLTTLQWVLWQGSLDVGLAKVLAFE